MSDQATLRGAAVARSAGAAVMVASLFIFVLALQPFAYGIWFQTEPVTAGLLATGTAAALCLLALDRTGHPVCQALSRRPLLLLGAFVLWNALASLFQDLPTRSWFGTPETGEGIFSYAALLMLAVLATVLWPYRGPRVAMVAAACAAALAMAALAAALPAGSPWRPELVASYAGTIGPAVVLIVAGAVLRPGWRMLLLGLLAGLPGVLFSFTCLAATGRCQNRSAIVFACLLGPLAFLLLRAGLRRLPPLAARRAAAAVPLLAPLLTGLFVLFAALLTRSDALYSVRSRALLVLAALQGMADDAGSWLRGSGWGSYNDLLYRHTYLAGVRGFHDGVWSPDWEGIGAGAFHSHSGVIEALIGGGVPAAVLYLLMLCAVVREARRPLLAVSATIWLLMLGSLCIWYPFMLSFPFLAVAMAAAIAPVRPAFMGRAGFPRRWLPAAGLAVALLLGCGCWATVTDARAGGRLLGALNRQDPSELESFRGLPGDHGRGGVHLWWAALSYASFISERRTAQLPLTPGQVGWYARLLDEVDAWTAQGRAGLRLAALTLALRNDIITGGDAPSLAELRRRETPHWEAAVMRVVALAPLRTDVAVPYLLWLAADRHYLPVVALCGRIFLLRPNDPVCLWYGGFAMLSDPMTEAAGLRQMRAALAAGVERVAPVTVQARQSVEAQATPAGE